MLKQLGDWCKAAARHSGFRVLSKREWLLLSFNEGGSKVNFHFAIYRGADAAKLPWMLRVYIGGYVFLLPARLGPVLSNKFK